MTGLSLAGAFETSRSALRASQLGLAVTAQNVAGADQDGYVRRRVDTVTLGPAAGVSRIWATVGPGASNGVQSSVNRLADVVLDGRVRVETSREAAAGGVAATLRGVEGTFDEPSDTGLAAGLDDLWNSFTDLASGSGETVLAKAGTVVDRLHNAAASLADQEADATARLGSTVDAAAGLTTTLGRLNEAIAAATASGQSVPDLLDQRDRVTSQLASSIGATTTLAADGTATVTLGGASLVAGSTVTALAVGADGASVTVDGAEATLTAGSAAAEVSALRTTLPAYRARLDEIAVSLRDTVNSALTAGYTASGSPGTSLFTGSGAADLAVAVTDPSDLAVTSRPGSNDSDVAQALSQAGLRPDGPDSRYRTLIRTVGAESARAADAATVAGAATAAVTSARQSAESVSVDEELTAMLGYQRSYQAASRVLTTVDEMLDQLINRTGRVGT